MNGFPVIRDIVHIVNAGNQNADSVITEDFSLGCFVRDKRVAEKKSAKTDY